MRLWAVLLLGPTGPFLAMFYIGRTSCFLDLRAERGLFSPRQEVEELGSARSTVLCPNCPTRQKADYPGSWFRAQRGAWFDRGRRSRNLISRAARGLVPQRPDVGKLNYARNAGFCFIFRGQRPKTGCLGLGFENSSRSTWS